MKHTKKSSKALTVTIVIPAFNEEGQIRTLLDSISCQSVMPDSVLVIDNNSTDTTRQIAAQYGIVTMLDEQKQGIVHARNCGFDAATTDIIARVDADTVLPDNWVKKVIAYFEMYPDVSAITGPCHIRDWHGKWLFFYAHRAVYFLATKMFVGHDTLFGSNMAIRRSAWESVRYKCCLDLAVHEDMDLASHLRIEDLKVAFVSGMEATISPRRILHMKKYPGMWLRTNLRHNRLNLVRARQIDSSL